MSSKRAATGLPSETRPPRARRDRSSCSTQQPTSGLLHPIGTPVSSEGDTVTGLGEIRVELRNHNQRLTANHDSIGVLRERTAEHATKIGVITTELRETREDIGEMKLQLGGNTKALYITATSMFGFMLSICGLIAVLLANHA